MARLVCEVVVNFVVVVVAVVTFVLVVLFIWSVANVVVPIETTSGLLLSVVIVTIPAMHVAR